MGSSDVVLGELATLFQVGTVGDVDDHQLLERFLSASDPASEAAFAALVERHGPMVLRLCRRRLGNPHDAQDAFQATFLILVRRARSIRNQRSVASWLFGVASRVSSRARRDEARRNVNEQRSVEFAEQIKRGDALPESWPELYEEIGRLPDRYRLPIVLHYLEDLTYEQVAKRIGCPLRTVQTRLARGRARLRARLTRRGLESSAGLLVAAPLKEAFPADFSRTLVWKVARDACRFASGSAAPLVSVKVASWTSGVLRTMIMAKFVSASVLALAIGGIGVGAAVLAQQGAGGKPIADRPPAESPPKQAAAAKAKPTPKSIESQNRVIREKLDESISVNLENPSLQDLLKYIKLASTKADDNGIPIYVEPAGLQEAGQTMSVPVEVSFSANRATVPIKNLLESVLRPLGLSFTVSRGLLIIDSRTEINQIQLEDRLDKLETKLDRILKSVEEGKWPRGGFN